MNPTPFSRRRFLVSAAATASAPMIVPASVLGRGDNVAPSERIVVGVVGWGMMGPGNTDAFLQENDCQVAAACDVDSQHLQQAVDRINGHYENKDCRAYSDYREMMARDDIDAVMLAVPDHWHALTAVEAARQGKDIYGEKPLAKTVAEQQAIVKAVQENQRIWQTGSWQRSGADFRRACEIVRNGLIGKVKHVEVGLPSGHHDFAGTGDRREVSDPPKHLGYEMWIGPSQEMPYIEARTHMNWRWHYNVGGGQLLDWIGHHCDIAHWGLDFDGTGPVEVRGEGEFPPKDAIWNTATTYKVEARYANGVTMTIAGGIEGIQGGTKWIGSDGWVHVDRGRFECSNREWMGRDLPEDLRKVRLYETPGHHRNFLDCIRSRKPTITPAETAHRSAVPGHLGLIAMLTGRVIRWDPEKEEILGDAEATRLLGREYRGDWKLA